MKRPKKHFTILSAKGVPSGCFDTTSDRIVEGIENAVKQGKGSIEPSDRALCEFCDEEDDE